MLVNYNKQRGSGLSPYLTDPKYRIVFSSKFYIHENSLNRLFKLIKSYDHTIKEIGRYKVCKDKILLISSGLTTEEIYRFINYFIEEYDYLRVECFRVKHF